MASLNLPFGASAPRRAPTTDELADGYGCGDADLELFNFLAWWLTGQSGGAISAAGLTPDGADLTQLTEAIVRLQPPATGAYLGYVSATSLRLSPSAGGQLWVAGRNYPVPANLTIGNAGLGNNGAYFVYAYVSAGALALEISTTGYTLAANGIPQKTGDATRTLVGRATTNGSGQFQEQGAGVISWFCRQPVFVASFGSQAASAVGATAPTELNTAARATFITWAQSLPVTITGYAWNGTAAKAFYSAIAADGAVISQTVKGSDSVAGAIGNISQTLNYRFTEGLHYISPFGATDSGGAANFDGLGSSVLVFG